MKHYIKDDVYYIEDKDGKVILSIKLLNDEKAPMLDDQIELVAGDEVFTGPVKFLLK